MTIEEEIKQPKFSSVYQKAVINLIFTSNWLINRQQTHFKPFGITGQQFNVLRILKGQHPNSISAKEIKFRMLDMNSDISRLLNRLLAKKLIDKRTSQNDKRASDVFITKKGLELLNEISRKQNTIDRILELSEAEALQLSNLLDKGRGY